jgi:Ca2+-binding EF-hand superfamily protein
MRLKFFIWGGMVVLFTAVTALLAGCAPLNEQQAPMSQQAPKSEFRALCNNIAKSGGGLKITKDEFLAASKDKDKAEKAFNMCDVKKQGFITEEDVDLMKMQELKSALAEPKDETSVPQKWQREIEIIQPRGR